MQKKKRPHGLSAAKRETIHNQDSAGRGFVQSGTRKSRERPILFSGDMVRAIRAGKRQTRRVVGVQPVLQDNLWHAFYPWGEGGHGVYATEVELRAAYARLVLAHCPYGVAGDRLWVRETFVSGAGLAVVASAGHYVAPASSCAAPDVIYRADGGVLPEGCHWRPSIFMPRAASRLTLNITAIRVERLQAISEQDARAEGVDGSRRIFVSARAHNDQEDPRLVGYQAEGSFARDNFQRLWDRINGGRKGCAWSNDPFVFVITFEVTDPCATRPIASPSSAEVRP